MSSPAQKSSAGSGSQPREVMPVSVLAESELGSEAQRERRNMNRLNAGLRNGLFEPEDVREYFIVLTQAYTPEERDAYEYEQEQLDAAASMEELEAVDWYNQRADACKDEELKAILEHNRDEEKEHASMVLEWIRRKDPSFSKHLKDYLFTEKPIAHK